MSNTSPSRVRHFQLKDRITSQKQGKNRDLEEANPTAYQRQFQPKERQASPSQPHEVVSEKIDLAQLRQLSQ